MRIGLWWIDLYTLRITGAAASAIAWLLWRNRRQRIPALGVGLLGLAALALLLGRGGYVLRHYAYFQQNPAYILDFRRSAGIHGLGALWGGLLGTMVWAAITRQPGWRLLSLLTPAALWMVAGSWWACGAIGCVWGRSINTPTGLLRWVVLPTPDLYRSIEPRIAVPALNVGWAVTAAILSGLLKERGAYVLPIYMLGAAALTLPRGDAMPHLASQRLDTLLYGGLAVLSIIPCLSRALPSRTGFRFQDGFGPRSEPN